MKIAVLAVTKKGVRMAERVAALLTGTGEHTAVLVLPGKFSLLRIEGQRLPYRRPLREVFGELFAEYQGIVCIMALGIVVRLIAPHLQGKSRDPGVVVMDELGQNVVSVLSGHWGGANALTVELAKGLDANPVITTATDVNGFPAVEMLAKEHSWVIEPSELVKKVNSAIVNGEKVIIYSDAELNIEPVEHIEVKDFAGHSPSRKENGRVVLVTNRAAEGFPAGTLFLRPSNLCIGIGCRRGTGSAELLEAVKAALAQAGRAATAVKCLASVDVKSDEQGLLAAAGELGLPVDFFPREELAALLAGRRDELSFSEFVNDRIGVGGVCEPAAILGAGEVSRLILPKTKFGKVTIAIAEGDWL